MNKLIEIFNDFLKWRESLGKNVHTNLYHHGMQINENVQGVDMWQGLLLVVVFWISIFIIADMMSGSKLRKWILRKYVNMDI